MKQPPAKQDKQTSDVSKGANRALILRELRTKRDELVRRAGLMGRSGYMASCFELQNRAAAIEDQIFAVEFAR